MDATLKRTLDLHQTEKSTPHLSPTWKRDDVTGKLEQAPPMNCFEVTGVVVQPREDPRFSTALAVCISWPPGVSF